MRKYLLAAVWPTGMSAITGGTVAAMVRAGERPATPAGRRREGLPGNWPAELAELVAVGCAGGGLAYAVMAAMGRTVVERGPELDEPLLRWIDGHQVKSFAAVMERLGKIGNTWTTWGAAGTAGACLAVSWPERKWLPPAVLAAAILVDHYTTIALRRRFRRPGPPSSPLGTYPSGGCDRVVLFYGLVADMLWREFSGTARGRAAAIGSVTALTFNEAFTRAYLGKHWFTDCVTGSFYGAVLLAPFLAAVRHIAGPPRLPGSPPGP